MEDRTQTPKTGWHRLLAKLLEELLTPVGITVHPEVPVMSDPPKVDILLLTKENKGRWTPEQMERLPDGVRERKADHVLLEFKYTQSINKPAFVQALIYDDLYKSSKGLSDKEVRTFLLSAKTPRKTTLKKFGYNETDKEGVYLSNNVMLDALPLISLNDLANTPHNSYIKCFASQKKEKRTAFNMFKRQSPEYFSLALKRFMTGLYEIWFTLGGDEMNTELTPEQVEEMGKIFGEHLLASLPSEEVLARYKPEERLKGLKSEEIFSMFKPEEIRAYLDKLQNS